MSNNPTASDKRRFAALVEIGCLACKLEGRYSIPQIHHVRIGSEYKDHQKTYGICMRHHVATAALPGIPNRHGSPKEFADTFGDDDELLVYVNKLL